MPEQKAADLLGLQITVRHLYSDLLQSVLRRINIRVTLRLGQMNIHGSFHEGEIPEHTFDLINGHFQIILIFFSDNPVCSALYLNGKVPTRNQHLQAHLGVILRPHAPLNLTVQAPAHEHSVPVWSSCGPAVDVSFPQNELHQASNRNTDNFFFCVQ